MASERIKKVLSYPIISVDTNVFIYALEDNKNFPLASEFFRHLFEKGPVVYTSVLSILESIVPLYKLGEEERKERVLDYVNFIEGQGRITVINIDPIVALKSAELRAKYHLKTPDAIQLATAVIHRAAAFITADRDFKVDYVENVKIEKI